MMNPIAPARFAKLFGLFGAVAVMAAGCATPPPATDTEAMKTYEEANDPLEPLNRGIFEFNRGVDFWIIRPASVAYKSWIPDPIRDMVRNFLDNLRAPVNLANELLQGDIQGASDTFGRFAINSVAGVGGLFDVATHIPARSEDFGQTLAVWGAPEGPYLILPVLGPSPPRDTVGLVADYFMDPINWWARNTDREWISYLRTAVRGIDTRSRNLETLDEIERTAIDFYATIRSLYRQRRADEIRDGRPGPAPVPEISFDSDDSIGTVRTAAQRN